MFSFLSYKCFESIHEVPPPLAPPPSSAVALLRRTGTREGKILGAATTSSPLLHRKHPLLALFISFVLGLFLVSCQLPPQNKILDSAPVIGFEQVGPITVYNKTNLFDFMNGEVVVYFPLGFRLLYTRVYMSEATDAGILVEIYDMSSPDGARDVYAYYSEQEGSVLHGIGESAWTDRWLVLFRRHIHFVRLSPDPLPENPEKPTQEEMIALARKIDEMVR